jgi:hypothetical protein
LIEPTHEVFDVWRFASTAYTQIANRNNWQTKTDTFEETKTIQKIAETNSQSIKQGKRQKQNPYYNIVWHT